MGGLVSASGAKGTRTRPSGLRSTSVTASGTKRPDPHPWQPCQSMWEVPRIQENLENESAPDRNPVA